MYEDQQAQFIAGFPQQIPLVLAGLAASTTTDAPEVKNFGTAKRPDYRQRNGKERMPVA